MPPFPLGAQLSRRSCAGKPRSPSVRADHPLFPWVKMSLLADWAFTFPAFSLLLEFQQAGALTESDCVLWWFVSLSLRLADFHREVWDIALSFKALKGVTHSSSFVCSLSSFCCTASPPALIDFCTELVKGVLNSE